MKILNNRTVPDWKNCSRILTFVHHLHRLQPDSARILNINDVISSRVMLLSNCRSSTHPVDLLDPSPWLRLPVSGSSLQFLVTSDNFYHPRLSSWSAPIRVDIVPTQKKKKKKSLLTILDVSIEHFHILLLVSQITWIQRHIPLDLGDQFGCGTISLP